MVDTGTSIIAVFRTHATLCITKPSVIHTFFHSQVEHRFLLSVVNTRHSCHIALALVGLDFRNNIYRYVLQGNFLIVEEEFLSFHQNLAHRLAVDGDVSILIHLCSREHLDKCLQRGPFRHRISRSIEHEGIPTYLNFRCHGCHLHSLEQFGVFHYHDASRIKCATASIAQIHQFFLRHIANEGNNKHILSSSHIVQKEFSLHIRSGTHYKCTIGQRQQTNCGTCHSLVRFKFYNRTTYLVSSLSRSNHASSHQQSRNK